MRSTPAAGARNDGGCEDLTSLAFLGTPDVAVLPLQALHRAAGGGPAHAAAPVGGGRAPRGL